MGLPLNMQLQMPTAPRPPPFVLPDDSDSEEDFQFEPPNSPVTAMPDEYDALLFQEAEPSLHQTSNLLDQIQEMSDFVVEHGSDDDADLVEKWQKSYMVIRLMLECTHLLGEPAGPSGLLGGVAMRREAAGVGLADENANSVLDALCYDINDAGLAALRRIAHREVSVQNVLGRIFDNRRGLLIEMNRVLFRLWLHLDNVVMQMTGS